MESRCRARRAAGAFRLPLPARVVLALALAAPGCRVVVENDSLGGQGRDSGYSSGVRLEATWRRLDETAEGAASTGWPDGSQRLLETLVDGFAPAPLPLAEGDRRETFYSATLGHDIYTPEDLSAEQPILDDRPYAAFLYTRFARSERRLDGDDARRDDEDRTVSLTLGVVGPLAFGEAAQKTVHQVIEGTEPEGWDNQLENEPAAMFAGSWTRRFAHGENADGLQGDLLGGISGWMGNVLVRGRVGGEARVGLALPRDFGFDNGDRPVGRADDSTRGGKDRWVYAFAGADGDLVLHDLFLDGNTFADSQSVDRIPLVGQLRAGAVACWGAWSLGYSWTLRGPEFEENRSTHPYGVVFLNWSPGR